MQHKDFNDFYFLVYFYWDPDKYVYTWYAKIACSVCISARHFSPERLITGDKRGDIRPRSLEHWHQASDQYSEVNYQAGMMELLHQVLILHLDVWDIII